MAFATITPSIGSLPSTEADLAGTTVSANDEWAFDIRLTNVTTSAVTVRIAVSDGTNIRYLAYDYSLAPNNSLDVARGLVLPATWRLRGRAGTSTAVDYIITATRRSTL